MNVCTYVFSVFLSILLQFISLIFLPPAISVPIFKDFFPIFSMILREFSHLMQPWYISSVSAIFIIIGFFLCYSSLTLNFVFFSLFSCLCQGEVFLELTWLLDEDSLSVECHSIEGSLILQIMMFYLAKFQNSYIPQIQHRLIFNYPIASFQFFIDDKI